MSKRGWEPLNRWKKVPSKQNEIESTEQNADIDPEHSAQGSTNTGQGALRQTSARQYHISQETSSKVQSVSEYGTTAQQAMFHQDAMGLPAGQGVIEDNVTRRRASEHNFAEIPIGVLLDLAVAEKCARGISRQNLDMKAIKEAILEMGALEQFALRKDIVRDVMGRHVVEQCDLILGSKDPIETSLTKPATVETMEKATNVGLPKRTTPQSTIMAQAATQETGATGQYATKRDNITQSKLESVDVARFSGYPQAKEYIATDLVASPLRQPFMDPETTGQTATGQGRIRLSTREPGAVGQVATELDVITSFRPGLDPIGEVAAEDEAITPCNTESGAMELTVAEDATMVQIVKRPSSMQQSSTVTGTKEQTAKDHDTMRLLSTEPSDIKPFNTEAVVVAEPKLARSEGIRTLSLPAIHISTTEQPIMSQTALGQPSTLELWATRRTGIKPGTVLRIATGQGQGAIELNNTEPDAMMEQTATGQGVTEPLGTEPVPMGQFALEQGAIKTFSTELISTEQAPTVDIEPSAVLPQSRRSTIQGTSGLPAIHVNTTKPPVKHQIAIEKLLTQSTTEIIAMEQNDMGQDDIRSLNTKLDAIVQVGAEPGDIKQSDLEQDDIRRYSLEPVDLEQATTKQGQDQVQNSTNDIGQSIAVQKPRRAANGALNLSATNIITTEPDSVGPIPAGQSPLRQVTTELGGIGQSVETEPTEGGTWTQTELSSEIDWTRGSTISHTFDPKVSKTLDLWKSETTTVHKHPRQYRKASFPSLTRPELRDGNTDGKAVCKPLDHEGRQTEYYRKITRNTYLPDWIDLDRRPLPRWYDEAKVGIIVHWGLYSVPSYKSEWFWYLWKKGNREILEFMSKMYRAGFTYQEFGPLFKAQYFDPVEWATLFAKAGAKYVILTAKHHDGFKLFPSKSSCNWNSYDVGPKRDIVKELSEAVVGKGLKFGIYYSLYEWYNPIYEEDKKTLFKTRDYVNEVVWPDLMQLVNSYKPSILWTDGDWEANEYYWKSQDFISWVYNDSAIRDDVVVNNRWGCKESAHGDFYNRDERHNQPINESIFTKFHKWEASVTMDMNRCWCHRREIKFNEVIAIEELLVEVVSTVSCGGNILINVGPSEDGLITPLFEERLLQLGEWLEINGEAIYGSSPWMYQTDDISDAIYYTCTKERYDPFKTAAPPDNPSDVSAVYTIFFKWPLNSIIKIRNIMAFMKQTPCLVTLLGDNVLLTANLIHDAVYILLPDKAIVKSNFAWTLKFLSKNLLNDDLGSIVIPLRDTALKLSKSGSRLGSRTGMRPSSKIIARLGSNSKSFSKTGSRMSKLH